MESSPSVGPTREESKGFISDSDVGSPLRLCDDGEARSLSTDLDPRLALDLVAKNILNGH